MSKYTELAKLLTTQGYNDLAMTVLKNASVVPGKDLALQRMESAFQRGGLARLFKTTEKRIQKTKDQEKLKGIAEAIEAILTNKVQWLSARTLQREDIDDFGVLSSLALKKAQHTTTIQNLPDFEKEGLIVIRKMVQHFKNKGVQEELSGRLQSYAERIGDFVTLYNAIVQTGVAARDLWVSVEDDPLWKLPQKSKIQLIKTKVPVYGRYDILVVDAWVDRRQGVGYITRKDYSKVSY